MPGKIKSLKADIVSGRHFFRKPGESVASAIARFQTGENDGPVFDFRFFHINIDARFQGDVELPFTHAIFLARKDLLLSNDIDTFYNRGNGYREESDVQAKIYSRGGKIIMTNDTHSTIIAQYPFLVGPWLILKEKIFRANLKVDKSEVKI